MPVEVLDSNSLAELLIQAGSKLVIIDFYADWCGPCRAMAPVFEDMSQRYPQAVFLKVNCDNCRSILMSYGIQGLPTFLFLKNGQEVGRVTGAQPDALRDMLLQHIGAQSDRVASPEERAFLEKYTYFSKRMMEYEDELKKTLALSVIPVDELKEASTVNGEVDEFELLKRLLNWFKTEFFSWMDAPKCDECGSDSSPAIESHQDPTSEEKYLGAFRVEMYKCNQCSHLIRFPRYNNPAKLLETRTGRCGEWANCFTLCCRALDFETRWVHDETDHVWCEVWIKKLDRWVHCDPCENVIDTPLLYEKGWGKKLSYVMAFGLDHVRDVTWRYTFNHLKTLKRRNKCRESVLRNFLEKLNSRLCQLLQDERKNELERRYVKELIEFLSPAMQLRDSNDAESQGRKTGSTEWKEARGEMGNRGNSRLPVVIKPNDEEIEAKKLLLNYYSNGDYYERNHNKIDGYETLIYSQQNIIASKDPGHQYMILGKNSESDEAQISWRFDLSNVAVKNISLIVDEAVFRGGNHAVIKYTGGSARISEHEFTMDGPLSDGYFELTVNFSKDATQPLLTSNIPGRANLSWVIKFD